MCSGRLAQVPILLLLGCGGAVDDGFVQRTATGGHTSLPVTGGTSSIPLGSGGMSTGGQIYSTYTTQRCPDAGAPIMTMYCDPFAAESGCPADEGCMPKMRSSQDPCQPTQYYFVCDTAGTAEQADYCDDARDCAPGFICVVTSQGTQCQRACNSNSSVNGCAPGMRCDPIDVPGVGTCS